MLILASLIGVIAGCKKDEGPSEPVIPPGTVNEVEPNDQTAQSLGALGTTDITVNGGAATANDVDKFLVNLSAASTNLRAEISWTGAGDLDVGITDTSGTLVAFQRTGANPERCIRPGLGPGRYTIYVSANSVASQTAYPQVYALKIGPRQ